MKWIQPTLNWFSELDIPLTRSRPSDEDLDDIARRRLMQKCTTRERFLADLKSMDIWEFMPLWNSGSGWGGDS